MSHFDFTPFYCAIVGFDQVVGMMDRALSHEAYVRSFSLYDIVKIADDAYCFWKAVASFATAEILVEVKENALVVSAQQLETSNVSNYLGRGIVAQLFKHRFRLTDHFPVVSARHTDGMLHVDLQREVPERLKVQKIEIPQAQRYFTTNTVLN